MTPTAPVPTSLAPCWLHTPAERVNTHAAPTPPLSPGPPTKAVFPSADSATDVPCCTSPCSALPATAPVPTSLPPCWLHVLPERVYTHTAPAPALSPSPPTMAVFPSPDSATDQAWKAFPTAP